MAMRALARSRALFHTAGQGDAWKRHAEEVRATVSRELDALTRNAAGTSTTGKQADLEGVVAMLHALEQVCASSALMPLLASGFSALGDQSGDGFFIDFIRHMNGDQRTAAPQSLQRGGHIPLK